MGSLKGRTVLITGGSRGIAPRPPGRILSDRMRPPDGPAATPERI